MVQTGWQRRDMRDTVPPCETTSGGGAPEPPHRRQGRPRRLTRQSRRAPNTPGGDPGGSSRPAQRPNALNVPPHRTREGYSGGG